jgi:HD-like signal output (HDOD) protein
VAHQYLSKPCDAEELRSIVERTHRLNELLREEAVRNVVGRLDALPSVPRTYSELVRAVQASHTAIPDLVAIVESDPAMCAKILQLVNSAYFGCGRRIISIAEAVAFLGSETLKALTLTAHVFTTADGLPIGDLSIEAMQRHALLTARLARKLPSDPRQADEAFTAGLVHDIGKVLIALAHPVESADLVRDARADGRPFHLLERERFGVTHAEAGAYLLGVWGLPWSIVEAVAYHHTPSAITSGPRELVAVVHVADALGDALPSSDDDGESHLDSAFLEQAGFSQRLPAWRALVQEEVDSLSRAA